MERLCPLCRKLGLNSKLSAYPLNENEDIEMCENKQCIWPMGVEQFNFIPRVDEDLKELADKHKSCPIIPISTELSLYTPPVTPVDTQETKTDVKGTTDSYASPATIVKDIQVFSDHSPSIFDIDSPEKAKTSQLVKSCDKTLGVSGSNRVVDAAMKKSRPTVMSTEMVSSLRILKKIPMKKVILKKAFKPAMSNVNMPLMVPLSSNGNSLQLPKSISDTSKLEMLEEGMQVEDKVDQSCQNFNLTEKNVSVDLPVNSANYLINVDDNQPVDVNFMKQEDYNIERIIEDLQSGNINQPINVDDEWLNSFFM